MSCSATCNGDQNGQVVCNKRTGVCPQGCHDGWHGTKCDEHCPLHCEGNCKQDTGACHVCQVGFYGEQCDMACSATCIGDQNGQVACDKGTGDCTQGVTTVETTVTEAPTSTAQPAVQTPDITPVVTTAPPTILDSSTPQTSTGVAIPYDVTSDSTATSTATTAAASVSVKASVCAVCGDIDSKRPCNRIDIMTRHSEQCPDDKPYCMNDIFQVAAQPPASVYKRCVTWETCNQLWYIESSDKVACFQYDPFVFSDDLTCHLCCHGDMCNRETLPPEDTRYKP